MRVLGYLEYGSGLATAGAYLSAPTAVQLFGPAVPLPGQLVQVQRNDTGAKTTGSTTIPLDDTIPQNTEGDQYMTQAITPVSAANLLAVRSEGCFGASTSAVGIAALFKDAAPDALKAVSFATQSANSTPVLLEHIQLAAATTSTTYKVRSGLNAAGTTTFNGAGGARQFGGVLNSFMEVREVMA